MTPEQPTAPRTVMKKVLVKRVKKILVKRPVAVPSATAPAVQAISRPAPNPNVRGKRADDAATRADADFQRPAPPLFCRKNN